MTNAELSERMREEAERLGVGVLDTVASRQGDATEVANTRYFFVGQKVQFVRKFRRKLGEAKIVGMSEKANELQFDKLPKEVKRGDLILIEGV